MEIKNDSVRLTRLDYYHVLYEKIVRIDVYDFKWLKYFLGIVLELKHGDSKEIEFCNLRNVRIENIKSFKIVLGRDDNLVLQKNTEHLPVFVWTINLDTLVYIITTIIDFIKDKNSGHHYYYEKNDYVVVFSYQAVM